MGTSLQLEEIGAAIAVLGGDGALLDASPSALRLLDRFGSLHELAAAPIGEAIMLRPGDSDDVLGCTRYDLGGERSLVLLREITEQQRALSRRLHRQRLESTGRLVAHIAHDLRAPLSSIVYSTDLLGRRELPSGTTELLHEVQVAAEQLRRTIAGLLDFVRLGPPVAETVSLRELVDRVSSLLRSVFRAGRHELAVALHDEHVCVCGNPIAIEQILVNLLVNATEAATDHPVRVKIASEPVAADAARAWRSIEPMVCVRVSDDGPGVPHDRRASIFEPFVTTKPEGTGIGLTVAREAAEALGGHLALEDSAIGASFALVLPIARGNA